MLKLIRQHGLIWIVLILVSIYASTLSAAESTKDKALERANNAIKVLNEVQRSPERSIPLDLLREAKAVIVVPEVIKIGLILAGRRGTGLLSVRRQDGSWSDPVYVSVTGGSVGFQAGLSATDVVLVFRSASNIDDIVHDKFTLGVNAAVAAGPVGRDAHASTDAQFKAQIYSYSRSQGLFAGVALDGTALTINNKFNQAVFGHGITPRRVMEGGVKNIPASLRTFRDTLTKYSK